MRRRLSMILGGLVLTMHTFLAGPDTSLTLTKSDWNKIAQGKDYTEHYRDGKSDDDEREEDQTYHTPSKTNFDGIEYLVYALVGAGVLFLALRLLKTFNQAPVPIPVPAEILASVEEAEAHLPEADLESLLKQALSAQDYKLALRVNFLMAVRMLSQRERISWSKEKTNWEYYRELKDYRVADRFKEITRNFERTWYSNHSFSEHEYEQSLPMYQALEQTLA